MQQIVVGESVYELAPDYRVVRLPPGADVGADVVAVVEEEGVAIVPATAIRGREVLDRPVYRAVPGGSLALPTGRVFVRFAEGTSAESRRTEIEAAGYQIDDVPAWAPHTAWCSPASGGVRESLADIGRLAQLPGVRHGEPQMLRVRATRAV